MRDKTFAFFAATAAALAWIVMTASPGFVTMEETYDLSELLNVLKDLEHGNPLKTGTFLTYDGQKPRKDDDEDRDNDDEGLMEERRIANQIRELIKELNATVVKNKAEQKKRVKRTKRQKNCWRTTEEGDICAQGCPKNHIPYNAWTGEGGGYVYDKHCRNACYERFNVATYCVAE